MIKKIIIDTTNAILGRTASYAAKQALLGQEVIIVNCNNAIIAGRKENILNKYKTARARGGTALKGPNFPREPFRIMKRTVRGMLPYKQARGLDALKRVICFNNVPEEYKNSKKVSFPKELKTRAIKLAELGRIL